VRHLVGRALIGGLCVAAAAAIVALLGGEFDDTHARVVATALGFSVFAACAGAGDALRERRAGWPESLGAATAGLSGLAFAALVGAVWAGDEDDVLWRVFGILAVLALCGSHASLVLRGARDGDAPAVRALVQASIGLAVIVTAIAVLAIAEAFGDVDEAWGRVAASLLVALLLTTALPPLLRRFGAPASPQREAPEGTRGEAPAGARGPLGDLAAEIRRAADRLDALDAPPEVAREAARLRELAARAEEQDGGP
jgi:hypothetical protein